MTDLTLGRDASRAQPTAQRQSHAKTIVGTGIGNALEWYDWGVYAIFTPFFASQFFNGANQASAVLLTLAVFAVGFVARPFGGFLFGWLADHTGRKFAMAATVGAAAVGSIVIGVSPNYASIGVGASLILVLARLLQGLAHGGELPSAQTYISEKASRHNRGLWSSLIYVSGTTGNVVGVILGVILTASLDKQQMSSFGWRIPFLLGGALGLYALYMRSKMTETEVFHHDVDQRKQDKPRVWPQIVRHRKQALQVIGMTVGLTVAYYAWAISAPAYAISALKIDETDALWAGVVANLVFIAILPLWGMLSDRIGRKPVLLACALGTAAVLFPLQFLVRHQAWQLGLAMCIAMVFIAAGAAIVPAVYAELFPTHIRAVGVGVPYSICVALFGGTAPYLQTWIGGTMGRSAFTGYVIILLVISAAVILTLPETRGRELHEQRSAAASELPSEM
ncbi:MAG TPA: MFS transporter [Segeticoccus sp.]|uniref:MFS transporter n=1 Tax=Segeticoccus sp. TaxID=2706531 RepID=UPI002D80E0C2|nr:MFS transporter [Segeticoccus sp.]HET8599597.1 MFS transporter [Segeticoccus sp.]